MLGFGIVLSFLLFAGGVATFNIQRFMQTSREVAHTHEALKTLQQVHVLINQSEATHRGYLITDDPAYLQRRNAAFDELRQQLTRLAQLTADNPRQQSRLPEIARLIESRTAYFDNVLDVRRTQGLEKMRQMVRDALLRNEPLRLRALVEEMVQEEEGLLLQRAQEEERRAHALLGILAVLLALLAGFLVFLFLRIRHELAQRRLLEQEQKRLTDILDATPDYIATATLDGQYLYLNQGGRKLAGIGPHEDISGLTIAGMHPPWAGELIRREGIPAALNEGSWMGETAFLTRTGQEFPTSQVIIAHRDDNGTAPYLSTIARDISAQKRVEREITNAARYDKTHGEVLRIFNASLDQEGILQSMLQILADNHPMPASAVYLYNEWDGRLHLAASHAAPPGIAGEVALGEGLVGAAAQESRTQELEPSSRMAELAIASGLLSFVPAAVTACPIVYQEKLLGVLVVAASAAPSERERQFLERLCDQLGVTLRNVQQYGDLKLLAEQLRLRSEEIASKNERLEEASRMKSEFLANMSHELRTPLNAIIGFSEVMRDGLTGKLSEKQREYVSDIFESGQHLLSLINDVLDLSKIEAGKMELEEETTGIAALLANCLSIVKEKAAAHRVDLKLDVPNDLGECRLDARKVKQIVYNLLSNAVKFTSEGGSVALRSRIVSFEEASRHSSGMPEKHTPLPEKVDRFLEIAVSDTGIAAEDMPRLYQPFVQIDSSLSRRFEGTGLGLVMVRRLAELHGGAVAVASQPGQGSVFKVWLPYHAAIGRSDRHIAPELASLTPGSEIMPQVLVIEDDDKAADLVRIQLEAAHCSVTRAATAEIALTMLEEGLQPDLISLDILLPGMDGWEFLARIKNMARVAHIPVVILSIVADNNRNRGLSLGAAEVLQKPVSAEELAAALTNLGMAAPRDSGQPAAVLVVDDDPKAVEIIASHLENSHYTVLRAYGGAEGIQMAHGRQPDLIVLDLMMPEMSGFEVVEMLKQRPDTAATPILVLTAKLLTAEDRRQLNRHVMQIMEKSEFNHGRFIGEVRRALVRRPRRPAGTTAQE